MGFVQLPQNRFRGSIIPERAPGRTADTAATPAAARTFRNVKLSSQRACRDTRNVWQVADCFPFDPFNTCLTRGAAAFPFPFNLLTSPRVWSFVLGAIECLIVVLVVAAVAAAVRQKSFSRPKGH